MFYSGLLALESASRLKLQTQSSSVQYNRLMLRKPNSYPQLHSWKAYMETLTEEGIREHKPRWSQEPFQGHKLP
jgi:hypothetical protein